MKVINCTKGSEDYFFSVQATPEEIAILVNVAMSALISVGYIDDFDEELDQFDVDLSSLDPENMFKA